MTSPQQSTQNVVLVEATSPLHACIQQDLQTVNSLPHHGCGYVSNKYRPCVPVATSLGLHLASSPQSSLFRHPTAAKMRSPSKIVYDRAPHMHVLQPQPTQHCSDGSRFRAQPHQVTKSALKMSRSGEMACAIIDTNIVNPGNLNSGVQL